MLVDSELFGVDITDKELGDVVGVEGLDVVDVEVVLVVGVDVID